MAQVAARPDASVGALQTELVAWDGKYTASAAAAGPAKWRLRQEFLAGPYAALLRGLQECGAAAERARAAEADRRLREVRQLQRQRLRFCGPGRRSCVFRCTWQVDGSPLLMVALPLGLIYFLDCIQDDA